MLTLIRLQILQATRMPITFFWTVGLPSLLFFVFNYNTHQICFLLSYIVFSSYAYGAAIPLLADRESGFLKSFIQNSHSFWRYVVCMYCSITIVMYMSILLFLTILKISRGIDLFYSLVPISLISLPAFFITLIILFIRKPVSEISTLLNILMMTLTMLCFSDAMALLNTINPIYIMNTILVYFLSDTIHAHYISTFLFFAFAGIGFLGLARFNYQPVEGR